LTDINPSCTLPWYFEGQVYSLGEDFLSTAEEEDDMIRKVMIGIAALAIAGFAASAPADTIHPGHGPPVLVNKALIASVSAPADISRLVGMNAIVRLANNETIGALTSEGNGGGHLALGDSGSAGIDGGVLVAPCKKETGLTALS
jgi:hypothetical protein